MNHRALSHAVAVAGVLLIAAAPAYAQGPYVSASLAGDFVRTSHVETQGSRGDISSGEALGFALRVGTDVGERWGIELELARPSEIESTVEPGVIPLSRGGSSFEWSSVTSIDLQGTLSPMPTIFPPIATSIRTRQRNTTLSAGVFARQELASRMSLVYIGGVAFNRMDRETEVSYQILPAFPALPGIVRPTLLPVTTKAVQYGVDPYVGVEGRVGLTEHVYFVPGLRLQGLDDGWLLRLSAGLGWRF